MALWVKGIIVFLSSRSLYIAPSFSRIFIPALPWSIRVWLGFLFWSRNRRLKLTMAVPDKVDFSLHRFFLYLWSAKIVVFFFSVEILASFPPNQGGFRYWVNWQLASHDRNLWKFLDDFSLMLHFISINLKILCGLLCCSFLTSRRCCPRLKCVHVPFRWNLELVLS